jgi:predicted RNA-binding protein with PUA-like domain
LKKKLPRLIPLDEIKSLPELEGLALIRRGNRLSVMPVTEEQWRIILANA